jgi:GAF domain-containing protein
VTTLMMIPMSTGTTWLGALLVEGHQGQAFTSDQARLCRNIADQAALVIDSQLLLRRAQQSAEREHALRDIAAALSSTLDSESVLQKVLENLEHVLPHDAANILVVEEGVAHPVAMRGYRELGVDEEQLKKLSLPIGAAENLRRMRDQKRPVIIPNTATYPDWVHTDETDWIGSYIGAPIYIEDQLLGFLSVDSKMRDFYTEEHATLLQAFADQAALAIQNSQRYQETRIRVQREEVIGNIAAQLQRANTVEDVLETAARTLQQALGNYDVALRLTVNPADEAARQSLPDSVGNE